MKNILIITPGLGMGGMERIACSTAEIMKRRGNVTLAVFGTKNIFFRPECEIVDLNAPSVRGLPRKMANVLKRAKALHDLKQDREIDYSIAVGSSANLPSILSGGKDKKLTTIHGWESISEMKRSAFLYRHALKIGCVSARMALEIEKRYPSLRGKTVTIYNPYDAETIRKLGAECVSDYSFEGRVLINHGRLEDVKNFPRLIKAFSMVHQACPDTRLLILGEGSRRAQLEELIAFYGLKDCVTLLGARKNPYAYLSKATLFVGASLHEGFSNSLVEAMAFLPAVAVDCLCGPREILSDGPVDRVCTEVEEAEYGILVPPAQSTVLSMDITQDDRILADGILAMLRDPAKMERYKKKAYDRLHKFSYEAYYERIMQIFEEDETVSKNADR